MDNRLYSYERVTGRTENVLDIPEHEKEFLKQQRILVTGAGGTIGSEIVRELWKLGAKEVLATDHDESRLHSLFLTSESLQFPGKNFCLMDIRDKASLNDTFELFAPTLIYHAAALKHLPVLQSQPREALLTNVFGTSNLLEVCSNFNVRNFVNISTDKAASPKSVLGRSKYLGELLVAFQKKKSPENQYISCRFGNVFASRGSVIETFASQIENHRAITLTDSRATRYYMSVRESVSLVLKSTFLKSGDVYIFDMGEAIAISDIIGNMLKIASTTLPIVVTGLQEGEKVDEELLAVSELLKSTSESRIKSIDLPMESTEMKKLLQAVSDRSILSVMKYLS